MARRSDEGWDYGAGGIKGREAVRRAERTVQTDAAGWGKLPEHARREHFRRQAHRRATGVCPHCRLRHEHHDQCGHHPSRG